MSDSGPDQPVTRGMSLNTTPLYVQLRDVLIDRIRSKAWRSGSPLPNELALSYEFRVSVGTVRKAMQEVEARGLVVRHQGRGTFVTDGSAVAGTSLLDRIRREDGSAFAWDPPHTSVTVDQADEREAIAFTSFASPVHLLRFEWLLGADGRRMVLQNAAVPTELVDVDVQQARHLESLDELFDRARVFLSRTEVAVSIAPADTRVAELLEVPSGTALQRLARRVFDLQGRTVALSEDWLALAGGVYTHVQPRKPD